MNKKLINIAFLFCTACSAQPVLQIPPPPDPPEHWGQISTLKLKDSSCPNLAGEYLESPVIFRSQLNSQRDSVPEKTKGSYYGHIPFHLADSREMENGEVKIDGNSFLIRQLDADNLYFIFVTHNDSIVEDHFKAEEGDFVCKSSHIEFPGFSSYGMVEGMSVNFQTRNVIFRDNEGALIIQETIGPYRGNPSKAEEEFEYNFFRYPQYVRAEE